MDNTINPATTDEIGHTGASHHTKQPATDTAVEEREVLIQRANEANTVGGARAVIDQIYEYKKMYTADAGMAALDTALARLEGMVG